MTPQHIPAITNWFLRLYKLEHSRDVLSAARKWIQGNQAVSPEQFCRDLAGFGTCIELIFLEQKLTDEQLANIYQKAWYPALIFLETERGIIPAIIEPTKKGINAVIFYSSEGELKENITLETLPGKIYRQTSTDGRSLIPVVTCFPTETEEEVENATPVTTRFVIIDKLFRLMASEKKAIFYILLYAVFAGIISLSLPLGVQSLVGFISSGQVVTSSLLLIAFILLGILINGVMIIMQLELVEYIQQRLFSKTAFTFAFKIPRIKTEAILKYYPPELMNRFFDTLTLQKGLSTILIDFSGAVLQTVFGILLLAFYHPLFLLLGTVLMIMLVLVLRITGPKGLKTSLKESAFKYFVANWLEEIARSISTFKLAGNTNFALEKTDYFVSNYIKAREDHFRILKIQYYSFVFFKTIITAMLLIFGAVLIVNRQINLGQFIAAEIVIILIMNAIEKIILKLDTLYDVLVSVEKITDVTGLPTEEYNGIELPVNKGVGLSVSLNRVSYRYPDRIQPALDSVTLDIASGEKICISGANGSGKSSIINIILGLFDSYEGTITFNGISLRDLNKSTLRSHIGDYVAHEGIFEGTILENITLGRNTVSMEDVLWAVDAAGIHNYINSLPDGFSTKMVGGGFRISESVSRKIIIARNIVQRPALLILDDFLLGVERSEKKRILELITSDQFGWTVILISNDPMILQSAQRVVVLHEGSVNDSGTFDEVFNRNAILKGLIQSYSINPEA